MIATVDGQALELLYTPMQMQIFCDSTAKYVVGACGRRSGKTFGAAQYAIDCCLQGEDMSIIWVDLQYNQIIGYVEAYFLPILRKLHKSIWSWQISRREIKIAGSTIVFRSVDRPDLLVGRGYKMMILNEAGIALYVDPTIWAQMLLPMLMDYENARAWLIGTPRGIVGKDGKDNLYFDMYRRGQAQEPGWQSFRYPTHANPMLSPQAIQEVEDEVARDHPKIRAQEIDAEFINISEMQIFDPSWWGEVTEMNLPAVYERKFISIDTAFSVQETADESAATVWVKTFESQWYCIDLWHRRVDYPGLVKDIKALIAKHHPSDVVIENKASGQSLIQTLKADLPDIPVHKWPQDGEKMGDKVSRATAVSGLVEKGNVHLLRAPWTRDLVNQCTIFPNGSRDDIVDSVSMALGWSSKKAYTPGTFIHRDHRVKVQRGYVTEAPDWKQTYST